MEALLEFVIEIIVEAFFVGIGWLISSTKVHKIIRILAISVILLPLIIVAGLEGFKGVETNITLAVICLFLMAGLLFAHGYLLIRIIKGIPLKHKKKERK